MKVNPIDNNQTSFGAIKFRNQKTQQRFMAELKRLPIEDFNKALNIIKNQDDNFVRIMIANHNGMNEFDKGLKLRATIADGIVDAQNSFADGFKAFKKVICWRSVFIYCNSFGVFTEVPQIGILKYAYWDEKKIQLKNSFVKCLFF